MIRILFVCYANICRSPMAEAIMRHLVAEAGLSDRIAVDSAGTHVFQPNAPAYDLVEEVLRLNDVPINAAARQVLFEDLYAFTYVLAMDRRTLAFLMRNAASAKAEVRLFLHDAYNLGLVDSVEVEVPYPDGEFDRAYRVIRTGCEALLAQLRAKHGL